MCARVAATTHDAAATVVGQLLEGKGSRGRAGPGGAPLSSNPPPPFPLSLHKSPTNQPNPKQVALVGKGLTFDSGGYNLKAGPGSMIEMMKFDMGGGAAVLGAARIFASLAPEAGPQVHFIVASCENMVNGKGMRPGDILTSAAGKARAFWGWGGFLAPQRMMRRRCFCHPRCLRLLSCFLLSSPQPSHTLLKPKKTHPHSHKNRLWR